MYRFCLEELRVLSRVLVLSLVVFPLLSCDSLMGLGEEIHATIHQETMDSGARYSVAVPSDHKMNRAAPLVLVLHYGGTVTPYYGTHALTEIFEPGLRKLGAIMVAPDCTGEDWTDPQAEEDVLAILDRVMAEYNIDPKRILITGYSMGGIGTWYLAPRHPDLFSAALVVSGYPPQGVLDEPWTTPLYVIHSRADEILPYEATTTVVEELQGRGVPVELDLKGTLGHYQMDMFIKPIKEAVPWIEGVWN
jgi:predicted peptidase